MQRITSRLHFVRSLTCRFAGLVVLAASAALVAPAVAQPGGGPPPPQALPAPPVPLQNPLTAEKAILGKILFWDEQLASDGTVACGTCHIPGAGGADPRLGLTPTHPGPDGVLGTQDDLFGSHGVRRTNAFGHYVADGAFDFEVQATGRTSPSMIGAAYFPRLFWDGRASGTFTDPTTGVVVIPNGGALESQSLGPILNDIEMAGEGRSWQDVFDRLEAAKPLGLATNLPGDVGLAIALDPTYPALFQRAFGTPTINAQRIAFALASYQRTLIPDQSKFDAVARGQAAFTQAEQRGWGAFNSAGSRCNACHTGALLSDGAFHNLGLRPLAEDQGRFDVTGVAADRGRFKTPSLRNVGLRQRLFHTGVQPNLQGVLAVYDADGGQFPQNKDPLLNGLTVPVQVRADIIALLNTLTDPRVAAQSAPFHRPTLRSELPASNPMSLGFGAVAGSGGFVPTIVAATPPREGHSGFRIGLHNALGGQIAFLRLRAQSLPVNPMGAAFRDALPRAQVLDGIGAGHGFGTWYDLDATAPALVGLTYDTQWWIRDAGAVGGVAKSEVVRVTIEPR